MNEDLLGNGFDNEYKDMVQRFAHLLQQIVETVDKYGLKRRHFRKHRNNAVRFLKSVETAHYSSPIARLPRAVNRQRSQTSCEPEGCHWTEHPHQTDNANSGVKEFGTAVGTPQEGGFSQDPAASAYLSVFAYYI